MKIKIRTKLYTEDTLDAKYLEKNTLVFLHEISTKNLKTKKNTKTKKPLTFH